MHGEIGALQGISGRLVSWLLTAQPHHQRIVTSRKVQYLCLPHHSVPGRLGIKTPFLVQGPGEMFGRDRDSVKRIRPSSVSQGYVAYTSYTYPDLGSRRRCGRVQQ